MTTDVTDGVERLLADRAEQGLPPRVADATALRLLAGLFAGDGDKPEARP